MAMSSTRLDLPGALVAGACAVHCAALPFLAGSLAAWGVSWMASESVGHAILLMSLLLVMASLVPAYRQHRQLLPLLLVLAALPAFVAAEAFTLPTLPTALCSALGGGLVAIAHLRNRSLLRRT